MLGVRGQGEFKSLQNQASYILDIRQNSQSVAQGSLKVCYLNSEDFESYRHQKKCN